MRVPKTDSVVAAPFLYIVARSAGKPVVVAGTWLDAARNLEPTWKIEGDASVVARRPHPLRSSAATWPRNSISRRDSSVDLNYLGRTARLSVSGILDSGGPDDNQIFVNLPVAQQLAALPGKIELVQLSASGTSAEHRRLRRATRESSSRLRTFAPSARSPKPKARCSIARAC